VITLFRFLHDKDVFEAHYKLHLQKRLLGGRSPCEDAERTMISKLKSECGFQFTSKLEGMFLDLRNSEAFMVAYRRERGPVPGGQVEIDVNVLTSNNWPPVTAPPCRLPEEVAASAAAFRAYYLSRHSGRKLTWHTAKGTAEVRARFDGPGGLRLHELTVSTYQMTLLMLFNAVPEGGGAGGGLTLEQMREATGIPDDELCRHALSLTVPKFRVLTRSGKARELEAGETFAVNAGFDSKMLRVRIPLITMKSALAAAGSGAGGGAGGGGAGGGAGGASAAAAAAARGEDNVAEQVEEVSWWEGGMRVWRAGGQAWQFGKGPACGVRDGSDLSRTLHFRSSSHSPPPTATAVPQGLPGGVHRAHHEDAQEHGAQRAGGGGGAAGVAALPAHVRRH
jgi:hypothetical protein